MKDSYDFNKSQADFTRVWNKEFMDGQREIYSALEDKSKETSTVNSKGEMRKHRLGITSFLDEEIANLADTYNTPVEQVKETITISDKVNPYIKSANDSIQDKRSMLDIYREEKDDSIKDILMQYELAILYKRNIDDIVKQIREVLGD